MNSKENTYPLRAWFRFSLRTLIALVLMVGSFMGGWVANEARHRYIIKDDAQIEFIQGTQTMVIRGDEHDVEAIAETLSKSLESKAKDRD